MTGSQTVQDELVETAGRAAVYSLLALGLSHPDPARLHLVATRLAPTVARLALPDPLDALVEAVGAAVPTDLEAARHHHAVLFPPVASQDAPGYETGYRGDGIFQQAALMADVAGFYRVHGLRAGGKEMERPDHIVVQLDFMAVLARKEALARRAGSVENASVCRDTAASFLGEHLGCWAPAFGRRAAAVTGSPFLRGLGELLATWVEMDMEALGVAPIEVVAGPLPQQPPDDGACGPCPVVPLGTGP